MGLCKNCDKGMVLVITPGTTITRDMAIDAGDRSLEGSVWGEKEDFDVCPCCEGDYKHCKNCNSD